MNSKEGADLWERIKGAYNSIHHQHSLFKQRLPKFELWQFKLWQRSNFSSVSTIAIDIVKASFWDFLGLDFLTDDVMHAFEKREG